MNRWIRIIFTKCQMRVQLILPKIFCPVPPHWLLRFQLYWYLGPDNSLTGVWGKYVLCILGWSAASVVSLPHQMPAALASRVVTTHSISRHFQCPWGNAICWEPLTRKVSQFRTFVISRAFIEKSENMIVPGVSPLSSLSLQLQPRYLCLFPSVPGLSVFAQFP